MKHHVVRCRAGCLPAIGQHVSVANFNDQVAVLALLDNRKPAAPIGIALTRLLRSFR